MQHYRAPTRLLDWTEVLHVALHFAVASLPKNERAATPPRIYVMNPYAWNEEHDGMRDLYWPKFFGWDPKIQHYWEYGELLVEPDDTGIDWKFPIALYPPQRDVRLSAQRGFFTIHGYDVRPLEQISPELLVAIDLSDHLVQDAKRQLALSGTNEFTLFPDLEGLARYLRSKYVS